MPRLDYFSLWLVLVALAVTASGQEPVLTGLPNPEAEIAGAPPQDWLSDASYANCYPMYRCEDGSCCNQWWCETWYTRVELLTLARNYNAQDRTIIQTGAGDDVLSSNEIGFGLAPGISVLCGHRLDGQTALELVYFGANQWNQAQAFARPADLSLPGQLGALDDFNLANAMTFSLRSQLHNAEVNYFHDVQNISFLAGFRFLNWQEQLQIHSGDSDLSESDYLVRLSNNLLGGQIGARVARYYNGIDLEFTGKAGLFGNRATQSQGVSNLGGTTIVRNVSATNGEPAFVGDLNFSATCPLARGWRLRGGYNLMCVSGIALAANQLDFTNQPISGRRVRQDSSAFLHGFNVGLEAIW